MRYNRIRDALLMALIFACIFALIGAQIYIRLNSSENTQDAVLYTCKESLSFTGVFIRDETVIYSDYVGSGVMNYAVSDGSRLSKDSVIARIYDSYSQIYNRYRIERINDELENLEHAQDHGITDYAQPEFINTQISESYKNLLLNLTEGDLSSVYDDSLDMLRLMNIYNVSSNIESGFDERISYLQSQKDVLSTSLTEPVATISSLDTGYFTSEIDGYETHLNMEMADGMTADEIKEIIAHPDISNESQRNAIGKVFKEYSWKMVGVIDVANRYFVNQVLQFSMDSSEKYHTVTVDSITPTGNGNEAVIIISCNELDSELAESRVADVELTFVEKTGIRAPRSAIRFVDGEKGVYVLVGEKLEFKKLDVIYEGDDYVLSVNTADDEYLNLYDRIVIDPISALPGSASGSVTEAAQDDKSGSDPEVTQADTPESAPKNTTEDNSGVE